VQRGDHGGAGGQAVIHRTGSDVMTTAQTRNLFCPEPCRLLRNSGTSVSFLLNLDHYGSVFTQRDLDIGYQS
jgi:hypothetical protein